MLAALYGRSLALLTDLYQLTMAYGYWKCGLQRHEAVFHLIFREHPFGGGFALACGTATMLEFVERFRFSGDDLEYLATLRGADQQPLFDAAFLDDLGKLRLTCDVDAVPEGTPVFAQEPLVRVRGPILHCQLLETPLLTLVNFQTLVATKAARICQAAAGDPVIEFGLRRAQGIDGGVSAARAAYVGGCAGTSNVLAGRLLGIPVRGTHAHSWIMAFDDERTAFEQYAAAMPNNCFFLVDTYDTLQGVRHAVEVGRRLRQAGHEMLGIRLDSGDLAWLSIQARKILDEGGFPQAKILASSDLDEYLIASLKQQGARIDAWGVGTRLATAYDQPALGGVYKLSAIRPPGKSWQYRLKLSEQAVKTSTPGMLQVRRYERGGEYVGDLIYDEPLGITRAGLLIDPRDRNRRKQVAADASHQDLLTPMVRGGEVVYQPPSLDQARAAAAEQLARLSPSIKRFDNPHEYPVGLEYRLFELKDRLIRQARGLDSAAHHA
jgi:nicotinate phosphoribosyltransferase